MSARITTTIVSTVDLKTGGIAAHHDIEIDSPDGMPESLSRAVAQSAAAAVLEATS